MEHDNNSITFADKIDGYTASWAMGLAMSYLPLTLNPLLLYAQYQVPLQAIEWGRELGLALPGGTIAAVILAIIIYYTAFTQNGGKGGHGSLKTITPPSPPSHVDIPKV